MSGLTEVAFLAIAVLLVLSVISSKFSDRFGIPALVIFLIIGMLAGSEGLGGIYFDDPAIAQAVGLFALAVILFSGGIDTEWESIRGLFKEGLALATIGVLITTLILGVAAHWILRIPLLEGLLLGAITSSTDAAAVFSVLRGQGVRLKEKIAPLLELESGSNDPMAVFLTIGLIQLVINPELPILGLVGLFLEQMLIGAILGLIFGRLLLFLINRLRLGSEGLYPVLALGMLLLTFALTSLVRGSGFLATYIVGLTLGQAEFLHKRSLSRFFDGLAWLLQVVMFLTLGLLVFPSQLLPIITRGMILAVILIFVARPISIWVSLLPFRFSAREKAFLSWVGLRGAVPIILATYPRLAKVEDSGLIFNVVFFVVLTSVLVQGTTIPKISRWLKVNEPGESAARFPLVSMPLQGWRGVLQEIAVREDSPVIGRAIYQLRLPHDYLVVLISRGDQFIIPNGSIVLQANDRLLGLARPETHRQVAEIFQSEESSPPAA